MTKTANAFMRNLIKLTSAGLAAALLLAAGQAHADDCSALLKPYFDWQGSTSSNYVGLKVSYHKANNAWVAYQEVEISKKNPLQLLPGLAGALRVYPASLEGTGDVLFSDRFVPIQATGNVFSGASPQPFDYEAADEHTVKIDTSGGIKITNLTWGGTTSITGNCQNGQIYGFVPGDYSIVISLAKLQRPVVH